jgi:hypothetical protein
MRVVSPKRKPSELLSRVIGDSRCPHCGIATAKALLCEVDGTPNPVVAFNQTQVRMIRMIWLAALRGQLLSPAAKWSSCQPG